MLSIIGLALRIFLLLISAVVLALSVTLARQQSVGAVPPETGFGTFVGSAGLVASAIGMAGLWFDQINGKILMGLDTLMSLLYLAGASALLVAVKIVSSCTATDDISEVQRVTNKIMNGGCVGSDEGPICPNAFSLDGKDLTKSRCQIAKADYVFEYAGFIFGFAMVAVGFLLHRRGRGGTPTPNRSYT
ncbi:hypothetical protein ONZ43_g4873 [Nemania bipapillata]|uniref:Uncharacterized protein n=1 Tax=Nemania bipapillata TaxID=110536 RepID=A0ACC2IH70_9PEZI|nr:hypothetical protein ONZ43_g4873 [Nemania bipapillata]